MKISCSSPMVPGHTITEKAENLKRWGFDGIALFEEYDQWNEEKHKEVLTLAERTGIIPCEFVFSDDIYGHLMDTDGQLAKGCFDMYQKAAAICGEIGAVTELEFEYRPQNPLPVFEPYQQMTEEQEKNFLAVYKKLLSVLNGTKGKLLLEDINRYESKYLNSLADCCRITDKIAEEHAGILADLFHMSIEERDMPEAIRKAGKRICHVHLGDNNRLLPGYGSTDWKACFDALKEIGYTGFVNLECSTCGDPARTLPETAEFLRKLI